MSSSQHNTTFASAAAANEHSDALNAWNYDGLWNSDSSAHPFGDMMIESQDVDMTLLSLDMMPWFDSSHEFTGFFDASHQASPAGHGGGAANGAQGTPRG